MPKDVDFIRDNGGKVEHKDLSKPSRDDRKNPFSEDNISKEDRKDYKDTTFDPDMRVSRVAFKVVSQIIVADDAKETFYQWWKKKYFNEDWGVELPNRITSSHWDIHHFKGNKVWLNFSKMKSKQKDDKETLTVGQFMQVLESEGKNIPSDVPDFYRKQDFISETESVCFIPIWYHKKNPTGDNIKQMYENFIDFKEKLHYQTLKKIVRKGIDMIDSIISYFLSIKSERVKEDKEDGVNARLFKNRVNEDVELLEQCKNGLSKKYKIGC